MRRVLSVLAMAAVAALAVPVAEADPPAHVSGGGTGTFAVDLDGDRDIDGSHFGLGASLLGGGAARGHFLCLMAGNADFLGLKLMAVSGRVTGYHSLSADSVTLTGVATVNLAQGTAFRGVGFSVTLEPGGPGEGTLKLTVVGAFDGVPGDSVLGNSNYDLPTETVATGQIKIH